MSKHFTIVNIREKKIQNPKDVKKLFDSLKDGKYLVEINYTDKRSDPQNRYYWGLVVPIVQKGINDLGTELTRDETHEFLKARFNSEGIVNNNTGEVVEVPKSTTRLSKFQFMEYIERIQRFAAEFLSIVIPDPGTQTEIEWQ